MKNTAVILLAAFSAVLIPARARALNAQAYAKKPKLVVTIVVDQFRADQLSQMPLIAAGTAQKPGGFRFLTQNGAWFPLAEYDIMQSMTCPGHAMILTGSHPAYNGITINDWIDPKTNKIVYCTDDEEFGSSPRKLRSTTVGDELKNVKSKSRVVSLAFKTRSAVMLGGHRADVALWMDEKNLQWTTSGYYNKGPLPAWITSVNARLAGDKEAKAADYMKLEGSLKATDFTVEAAIQALKGEKLGQGADPDLLAFSLSAHDAVGHSFGPNSKEIVEITKYEDKKLAEFFSAVGKHMGGFDDVLFVLTADHGVPPTPEVSKSFKYPAGQLDFLAAFKKINARLDERFGSAGKKPWISSLHLLHIVLNQELLREKKLNAADVETEIKNLLLEEPGVFAVYTRSEFERGSFPQGLLGTQIRNTYLPGQSGDLVILPEPFFFSKTSVATTHMTGWSYDRSVPIVLMGSHFKPGVYAGGYIIDIAPTLAFVLGIVPPTMSEGRVLKDALK